MKSGVEPEPIKIKIFYRADTATERKEGGKIKKIIRLGVMGHFLKILNPIKNHFQEESKSNFSFWFCSAAECILD